MVRGEATQISLWVHATADSSKCPKHTTAKRSMALAAFPKKDGGFAARLAAQVGKPSRRRLRWAFQSPTSNGAACITNSQTAGKSPCRKPKCLKSPEWFIHDASLSHDRRPQRGPKGGHDVPTDKIVSRYDRSLRQIVPALPFVSRAYFWDNSGTDFCFLAEYEEGKGFVHSVRPQPLWFRRAMTGIKRTAFPPPRKSR